MATVNLGSIKFKWKGTYSGATAYTVDDVVEYNGSSYICKLASTGNLPTNTTYFDVMSSAGTNGTNGTDVGTVITTQGDLLYRDGSGLQRLGAGTAGQVLQTGGAGANPSWGTVSSDFVKLTSGNLSGSTNVFEVDGFFTSDYDNYRFYLYDIQANTHRTEMRFMFGGTQYTNSNYKTSWVGTQNASGSTSLVYGGYWNVGEIDLSNWGATNGYGDSIIIDLFNPLSTSLPKKIQFKTSTFYSTEIQVVSGQAYLDANGGTAMSGMRFFSHAGNNFSATTAYALYGIK